MTRGIYEMTTKLFSADILKLDCEKETSRITSRLRELLRDKLKRRGFVVAISGGIDSSVTAALCVRAIGKERVFTIQMPEKHSSSDTATLSSMLARHLEVDTVLTDISSILEAVGFYDKYDNAVRSVIPEYGAGWKSKIVLPDIVRQTTISYYSIVAQSPQGKQIKQRLPLKPYLEILAATNFKQRIRKMMEYYHADRLNYATTGTPNRLEYDQGFFVKLGDGAADVKPIAHLYKTQVFELAEYLGLPDEIRLRKPTTDTYSLPQGQDEFYFALPYDKMDLCLYAKNNAISKEQTAEATGLTPEEVERVFKDIDQKRATTNYLHLPPLLIDEVTEIGDRGGKP